MDKAIADDVLDINVSSHEDQYAVESDYSHSTSRYLTANK